MRMPQKHHLCPAMLNQSSERDLFERKKKIQKQIFTGLKIQQIQYKPHFTQQLVKLNYLNRQLLMSSRKPKLQIEIEQLGDQLNSKFQGYVNYTQPNEYEPYYEPNDNSIYQSRASNQSYKSNQTSNSDRSSLLQRAEQLRMQNKLTQNLKSLSRSKIKNLSNSRNLHQTKEYQQVKALNYKKIIENNYERELSRSKSAHSVSRQNSRAKILQEIAQKLKRVANHNEIINENQNVKRNNYVVQNQRSAHHSRMNSSDEEIVQNKSTVEKIKEFKDQLIKNRGGKLQHLLKDIKKSNKQVYKVVYTIKKSANNMKDTDIPVGNSMGKQSKGKNNLKKIANELVNIRQQLKEVKNKNEELLKRSNLRSETGQKNNNDNASQSSRLTNELEALEIDTTSNASGYGRKNSPQPGSVLYNPFAKNIQNGSANSMNGHYGNGYIIVQQPDFVQPCFACGCTCRGINKFH